MLEIYAQKAKRGRLTCRALFDWLWLEDQLAAELKCARIVE